MGWTPELEEQQGEAAGPHPRAGSNNVHMATDNVATTYESVRHAGGTGSEAVHLRHQPPLQQDLAHANCPGTRQHDTGHPAAQLAGALPSHPVHKLGAREAAITTHNEPFLLACTCTASREEEGREEGEGAGDNGGRWRAAKYGVCTAPAKQKAQPAPK